MISPKLATAAMDTFYKELDAWLMKKSGYWTLNSPRKQLVDGCPTLLMNLYSVRDSGFDGTIRSFLKSKGFTVSPNRCSGTKVVETPEGPVTIRFTSFIKPSRCVLQFT